MPGIMADPGGEVTNRALAELPKDGTTVSDVLRSSLIDDARHRAQEELRSEFAALAAIEPDRADPQILLETETLRPW